MLGSGSFSILVVCLLSGATEAASMSKADTARAQSLWQNAPIHFEANTGRYDRRVRFTARAGGYSLYLAEREAVVSMGASSLRMKLRNANPKPVVEGLERLSATTAYFRGRNRDQWQTNVPHFARVRYRQVYPGIDLVYYGTGRQIEYDFVVAPGARPDRIRLQFDGARKLMLEGGDLVIETAGPTLRQRKPRVYQQGAAGVEEVRGGYVVLSKNEVAFSLGAYDRGLPLVIDPVLEYSTYLGGMNRDVASVVGVDSKGRIWVAGVTRVDNFPSTVFTLGASTVAGLDIFVGRINPAKFGAESLEFLAFIGGTGDEEPNGIAIDEADSVYLVGYTNSFDFPLGGEARQTTSGAGKDAFLIKLSTSDEVVLAYSTYLGGTQDDIANAVAATAAGKVYVTGYTLSTDFPLANATQPINRGNWEAFIAVYDLTKPVAETLPFSTYLGGNFTDVGTAIGFDSEGIVYVAGFTASDDFPVTGGTFFDIQAGGGDVFLVKIDIGRAGLDTLIYATYYGGTALDVPYAMTVLPRGTLFLAGYTLSENLPLAGKPVQSTNAGNSDLFVARFDLGIAGRDALTWATYVGGGWGDVAYGMALDRDGKVYLTGYTVSTDFPLIGAPLRTKFGGGGGDAFLTILDPDAGAFLFSSYLGGAGTESAFGIAVDAARNIYLAGFVQGPDFPVSENRYKETLGGVSDAFVIKLRP
ncbi:MAG: SBBP repeat-containing protein [Bryobacteraceae bacterium]